MKTYFILALFALSLIGCQKIAKERWDYFPQEINLSEYNHLDFVKIKKGKTVLVHADEDQSSGYMWQTNSMDGCTVSISPGELANTAGEDGNMSSAGVRNFEVTANSNGVCLVEFNHVKGEEKPDQKKAIYFIVE